MTDAPAKKSKDEVKAVFDDIDRDRSGYIDSGELEQCCKTLGVEMSPSELADALKRLDTNGDGKISLEEFTAWFMQKQGGRAGESAGLSKLRQRLFKYETTIAPESTVVPHEIVETDEHYTVAVELPGFKATKDIKPKFQLTQHGFQIAIHTEKKSALADLPEEGKTILLQSRLLGEVNWVAEVSGVFDGKPEVNYKAGVLKIRFKKKQAQVDEEIDFEADF